MEDPLGSESARLSRFFCACGKKAPAPPGAVTGPVGTLPVDLVLCIYISHSIQRVEAAIIRVTSTQLGDLAVQSDRISVITFSKGVRQLTQSESGAIRTKPYLRVRCRPG
jgi:hypothetical protein